MSHGPLMIDLVGQELTPQEREMLQHPATGGVILFRRNFRSPEQISRLVSEIHALREPALLVAVDQEGGRVQRFQEGFVHLPPAAWYGDLYDRNAKHARNVVRAVAWLMASELRSVGVDFSFAPVLDLGRGISSVIGDRAFHQRPEVVAELAHAWMQGVHEAGMPAVGKHFPGHGGVEEDSHHALPVDRRRSEEIWMEDLVPFRRLIDSGLEAVMPAHVIYEKVAPELAGFSPYWLQEVLRRELGFQGVIFSDDLTMAAAVEAGDYPERARAALRAGCDMVLVCNNRDGAEQVVTALADHLDPASQMRLVRMHGRHPISRDEVHLDPRWRIAVDAIAEYQEAPPLSLGL
jgi:beta-N-acetylhexosaminidase